MWNNSLRSYRHIREEWHNSSKQSFDVPTKVCRGPFGCSSGGFVLLCVDTEQGLVYRIEDAANYFDALPAVRVEGFDPWKASR